MDKKSPLVSIIINNFNYGKYVSLAIESALSQSYPKVEVVVVDDGSIDDSRQVIESYGNQIVPIFKDNGGQASALNAGFSACHGEIICLLDSDDIFLPSKVLQVVNLFQENPEAGWVFTESQPFNSQELLEKSISDVFFIYSNIKSAKFELKKIDFRESILEAKLPNFTPSTSNLCFSRATLEKIMPMPEVKGSSGIAICDTYLKLIAVGISRGISYPKELGLFRIHGDNLFSGNENSKKRKISAEILTATGFWMLVKFPKFRRLSKKLFAKGLGFHWSINEPNSICNSLTEEYLPNFSYLEQIEILAKSFYFLVKQYCKG